ncbi:hypothetical protein EZV62_008556 [Acer yangbiense]|uniref:Uncharacterized protein n=1 Tax=Acer yangbiense TaxID=1000413 RepID=A0A5C7IDR4_9ROSI|nr:hypothetical protein EZV62_008556 [Acer yangbiense]
MDWFPGMHGLGGERVPLLDVERRLDAAGYLSSSVASVVQPLDFSFTGLFLSGVLALQLHYVRVTVDRHAFESPDFFKSRKEAKHAGVNVAVMSFPFDGFEEASSLTESCHMPASVQGGSLSSPPMTHADCSFPSISDSSVGRPTGTRSYLLYNKNQGLSMCSRHFISKWM